MNLEIGPNITSASAAPNLTPLFNIGHVDFSQSTTNAPHAFITTDNDLSISSEIYLTTENEDSDLPLNIINLRDNQIVKIEYQNEAGIINTEYIMNDHLMTTQFVENISASSSNTITENNNVATKTSDDSLNNNDDDVDINVNNSVVTNILNNSLPSPETDEDQPCETDLTSLNWLHNITNIMAVPNIPTPPISPPPNNKKNSNNKSNNCQEDLTININFYKKNGDKKPPFSYATLICMAMSKNGNKMTLSAIYNWIRENFLYYKKAHPSWQVICNLL